VRWADNMLFSLNTGSRRVVSKLIRHSIYTVLEAQNRRAQKEQLRAHLNNYSHSISSSQSPTLIPEIKATLSNFIMQLGSNVENLYSKFVVVVIRHSILLFWNWNRRGQIRQRPRIDGPEKNS
jgi:hypothetical protein